MHSTVQFTIFLSLFLFVTVKFLFFICIVRDSNDFLQNTQIKLLYLTVYTQIKLLYLTLYTQMKLLHLTVLLFLPLLLTSVDKSFGERVEGGREVGTLLAGAIAAKGIRSGARPRRVFRGSVCHAVRRKASSRFIKVTH